MLDVVVGGPAPINRPYSGTTPRPDHIGPQPESSKTVKWPSWPTRKKNRAPKRAVGEDPEVEERAPLRAAVERVEERSERENGEHDGARVRERERRRRVVRIG